MDELLQKSYLIDQYHRLKRIENAEDPQAEIKRQRKEILEIMSVIGMDISNLTKAD